MIKVYKNCNNIKLTCYFIQSNQDSELFSSSLLVKVGSLCDPKNKSGLAHYVEHMNMNFDKFNLEEMDGFMNCFAYTNYYATVYEMTSNSRKIEQSLIIIKNILNGNYLLEEKLEAVRKDIIKEWNRTNRMCKGLISNALFHNSIYEEQAPLGNINDINSITFDDIKDFFAKWYVQQNIELQIICSGEEKDVDSILKKQGFKESNSPFEPHQKWERETDNFSFSEDTLVNIYTGNKYENETRIFYKLSYIHLLKELGVDEKYYKCMCDIISDVLTLYLRDSIEAVNTSYIDFIDFSKDIVIMLINIKCKNWNHSGVDINNFLDGFGEWIKINLDSIKQQYFCAVKEKAETIEEVKLKLYSHFIFGRTFVELSDEQFFVNEQLSKINANRLQEIVNSLLNNAQKKIVIIN
nr:insulinase family protein [uncultured Lachnoclostridium sp.]